MNTAHCTLADKVVVNCLESDTAYSLAALLSTLPKEKIVLVESLTASLEEKHSQLPSRGLLPATP